MRKLVTRAFSAKAIASLRGRTEEIATGLLDEMTARSTGTAHRADVMAEYAALLPATVIAEMLGAPLSMRQKFLEWGEGAALSLDMGLTYRSFLRSERDIEALNEWMLGHFDELRRNPGENILSDLVRRHDTEGALADDELLSIATLLLAAGFETTVNLIGNGTKALLEHPDQLARLQAEPELWPNAVDEILRFESPVQRTARVAARDTEVCGIPVKRGSVLVGHLGGANRDPQVFTDPSTFDVGRAGADKHVSFSSGIHYCLGAALAKMEGEVGLRALFDRFPEMRADGPSELRGTRVLRGYRSMPVRVDPAPVGDSSQVAAQV